MISEERLKELIEQTKPVYAVVKTKQWRNLGRERYMVMDLRFDLSNTPPLVIRNDANFEDQVINYEDLYETKEQAEWARDFQRIERTEYLDLPSWEEINERLKNESYIDIPFYDPQYNRHSIWISPAQVCVCDYWDDGSYGGTDEEFNKEDYIKACEMAKQLFLGEEEK